MKIADVAAEYFTLFDTANIAQNRLGEANAIITQIMAHRDRYAAVEARTGTESHAGVPWYVIALIHNLECSLRFDQHLHNGDPLSRKTVNDPAGRPPGWDGGGTWEDSAVDALRYDRLDQFSDWDVARICFEFETFNGWGYRSHGIHSPYLWAGCQHYTAGKYVRDGVFDAHAVSDQIGTAVLLKQMTVRDLVTLRAAAVV